MSTAAAMTPAKPSQDRQTTTEARLLTVRDIAKLLGMSAAAGCARAQAGRVRRSRGRVPRGRRHRVPTFSQAGEAAQQDRSLAEGACHREATGCPQGVRHDAGPGRVPRDPGPPERPHERAGPDPHRSRQGAPPAAMGVRRAPTRSMAPLGRGLARPMPRRGAARGNVVKASL